MRITRQRLHGFRQYESPLAAASFGLSFENPSFSIPRSKEIRGRRSRIAQSKCLDTQTLQRFVVRRRKPRTQISIAHPLKTTALPYPAVSSLGRCPTPAR